MFGASSPARCVAALFLGFVLLAPVATDAGRRGQSYTWERIKLRDPETGLEYLQITSGPAHATSMYFEWPNFTADNKTVLFHAQRVASRDSPWDLFRADADGSDLVQLTDDESSLGGPIPSADSARIVFGTRGDALVAFNIDTFRERVVARCESVTGLGPSAMSGDGRYYVAVGHERDGKSNVVRFRTDGSEVVAFAEGKPFNHLTINWDGSVIAFAGEGGEWRCDGDGRNLRRIPGPQQFAHCTWWGRTNRRQGTLLPPGHGIATATTDDTAKTMIAGGPYFWHSASDPTGEWIVADTNWPDEGIYLVYAPSGRYTKLVHPASRIGHHDWTHPHPSLNRDATAAVYTSNETGLCQVYVVPIPEEIREELRTGNLNSRLRWRR